jgi:hypothetical protein
MHLKGLDQFITQGNSLRKHCFGDSHEDFNKWVGDVGEWLNRIEPDTGISAEWIALSVSPLKSGTNAYYDDSETWEIFDAAVSKRMEWLGKLPKVLETQRQANIVTPVPDISALVGTSINLRIVIEHRWEEAQKCLAAQCYTSSVIMMGSILEALLLLRMQLDPVTANSSPKVPRDKTGKPLLIKDWKLSALIDVAVDLGWLKTDRGKFSHALRESRNIVHPLVEIKIKTNFDEATCKTSLEVLKASVDDLIKSIP